MMVKGNFLNALPWTLFWMLMISHLIFYKSCYLHAGVTLYGVTVKLSFDLIGTPHRPSRSRKTISSLNRLPSLILPSLLRGILLRFSFVTEKRTTIGTLLQ